MESNHHVKPRGQGAFSPAPRNIKNGKAPAEHHASCPVTETIPGSFRLLKPFLTDKRIEILRSALELRTRYVTVVLDDIYHPHNISAVVRSCEAFGIQDIHVLQVENPFKPNKGVTKGSQQWITLHRHFSIDECVSHLKGRGYMLLGADPPSKGHPSVPVAGIELSRPVALIFGREKEGLHQELRNACDGLFHIPMKGLTESFNISVTVAISLYELRQKIEALEPEVWQLSDEEKEFLLDDWSVKSVRRGTAVLREIRGRLKQCKPDYPVTTR